MAPEANECHEPGEERVRRDNQDHGKRNGHRDKVGINNVTRCLVPQSAEHDTVQAADQEQRQNVRCQEESHLIKKKKNQN